MTDGSRALIPGIGIYATRVRLPDGTTALGACSVGRNPTFQENGATSVEVYILDRSLDLYGQRVRVSFIAHIRGEKRFTGVEELVAEIQRDVAETRRLLQ